MNWFPLGTLIELESTFAPPPLSPPQRETGKGKDNLFAALMSKWASP